MNIHQEHFGKKFYQDKKTGYWISTQCPKIRAHVWVWNHFHGKIPKGMHIHHRDGNKSNNDFTNLQILSVSDHVKIHFDEDPKRRIHAKEMADKYRHMTKEWHSSEEGRAWHRLHALKNNFGNPEPTRYDCHQCGKEYFSKLVAKERTRFCSNNCKSKWRRDAGLDDVEKNCLLCGKKFTTNKYSKTIFCSKSCGKKKIACKQINL